MGLITLLSKVNDLVVQGQTFVYFIYVSDYNNLVAVRCFKVGVDISLMLQFRCVV